MERCKGCPMPDSPEIGCDPTEAQRAALNLSEARVVIGCMQHRLGASHQTIEDLRTDNQDLQQRVDLSEQLIERLSVDADLGILTFNSQRVLFERMIASGILNEMHTQGYTVEMMLLDLDKLKIHNELGAHAGGNAALASVVEHIRPLYRRKTDVVAGILHHEAEALDAAGRSAGFAQVGRFEKGDEIITISFLPPHQGGEDRRNPLLGLEQRRENVVAALSDTTAVYPLRTRKSRRSIEDEFGHSFNYTIDADGQVHATVSATFAIARAQIPGSMPGFEDLFDTLDGALTNAKQSRTTIATRGVLLDLLA